MPKSILCDALRFGRVLGIGLLLFLGPGSSIAAEAASFLVDVWDTEKGLPDSTVTSITQTPDGYLWVGTYNGLARFDGVRFEIYDPLNTPELAHPRILGLFLDADGVLWINTYDGSLTSYRSGQFRLEYRGTISSDVRFSLMKSTPQEIAFSSQIGELLRRRSGETEWSLFRPEESPRPSIYFQDGQGQVWWQKQSQNQYGRLTDGQLEQDMDESNYASNAYFLTVDSTGRLWVGGDQGLVYWDNGECHAWTPTNGESQLSVNYILPLGGETNWILANGRLRKQAGRQWVEEIDEWRGLLGTAAGRPMGGHVDRNGGVWFNHYGNGLFYISPEGKAVRWTKDEGLPGNRVGAWFEDREGNIWVGVDRGGLARLRPTMFQVIGDAEGLPAQAVISVCERQDGSIWIGTYGGGVFVWNGNSLTKPELQGLGGEFVFSMCQAPSGTLWLSARSEDLYVVKNNRLQPAPWNVHGVKTLLADSQGRLWVGWKEGAGCWTEDGQQQVSLTENLQPIAVRALAPGPDGSIWFGSEDGCIHQFQDGRLERFQADNSSVSQPVWSLHVDQDGTVWAGTFRGGLLRLKEGKFTRYTKDEGLPSNVISQILEDDQGRLWCGSRQGVFHVKKSALNGLARGELGRVDCVVYGLLDGLPTLECSGGYNPACLRSRDGRLWFTTAKGLVSIRPDSVAIRSVPPPVVIEALHVDGRDQPLRSTGRERASGKQQLKIPPGGRQFRFDFTALSLTAPDKVRFRHRLEGLEKDWVEAGDRREAIYSSLPPGAYQFNVMACNNEGVWSEESAVLAFVLEPFFYQTWWFQGGAGFALLLGLIFGVRRLATRGLRRELALSEQRHAIERDRARIANDIHDDLGAGLTEITLLSELARRDRPENTQGYLDQIATSSRGLARAMDEIVWAVNPENDTLDGLMTYVSKLSQDYLNTAGIRLRLDVPAKLPWILLEAETRHHLFLAIKETLNNIVKHARATEVSLRLTLNPGAYTITIEDNGRGLLDSPAEGAEAQQGRLHTGHGMHNLQKRLAETGGQCVIANRPGGGTRVEFTLKSKAISPELASANSNFSS